ncbi:hypothetical protein GCM10023322_52160 [Rugosimonospora acidiphila]|uniref:Uncharacterized protein n=1 Tax=Rugosimonospora acidiphila TaxID=556531 RepID=A0ABP9S8M1_9ACTN
MTLVDRIQRLRTAAIAADDESRVKARTGALLDLAERLDGAARGLQETRIALDELRVVGAELAVELLKEADEIQRVLSELVPSRLTVDAPLDAPKTTVKKVEAFVTRARQSAASGWQELLHREGPIVDEELLDALGRSGVEIEAIKSELLRAQTLLMKLGSHAIPRQGDVVTLRQAMSDVESCARQTQALVDPLIADVILGAQTSEGLPLSRFTSEVRGELERLGIITRFRVIAR